MSKPSNKKAAGGNPTAKRNDLELLGNIIGEKLSAVKGRTAVDKLLDLFSETFARQTGRPYQVTRQDRLAAESMSRTDPNLFAERSCENSWSIPEVVDFASLGWATPAARRMAMTVAGLFLNFDSIYRAVVNYGGAR